MDNENYEPIIQNNYYYKGKNILKKNINLYSSKYSNVNICAYNINNDSIFPFQRFLLENSIDEKLKFPNFKNIKTFNFEELVSYAKVFLFGLLKINDYDKFDEIILLDGYLDNDNDNDLYIFFDITLLNIKLDDTYKNNNLFLILLDEILNQKHFCNIKINENVTDLFVINTELNFLIDENNNNYEIPVVGFVSKPKNLTNFTYVFGESFKDKNNLFGPYFYFTNFTNSFRHYGESIIRFALFLGTTKYIENYKNDPNDNSEIKDDKLHDDYINKNTEYLTVKISDYDSKWTELYDSVYVGSIELDDETKLKNTPIIVTKKYEQQLSLSYHYKNINLFNRDKNIITII